MDSSVILAIIALAGMIALLATGLEVAWSIGIIAVIALVLLVNQPLNQLAWSAWNATNSFTLTAVPLFLLMGAILSKCGVGEALYTGVERWLDRLPGALGCTTVAASGIFAAISGSTAASTALFGKVAFPSMESRGYSPRISLSSICMGATLASTIPPSLLLIVYGTWQGVSIVALFAAALIPGVIQATLYIITIVIQVKLNPRLAPAAVRYSWREKFAAIGQVFPFLLLVAGILGSIFLGVMTPTEAASLGAILSLVLALAYRRLTWKIFKASLLDAVSMTSFVVFLLAMTVGLAHALNMLGIAHQLSQFMLALPIGKYGTIIVFIVFYIILGCFMSPWEMLFLTFPFVMPIITGYNINLIWWGVLYILLGDISNVTPPFGYILFVLHSAIGGKYSAETIAISCLPFFGPILLLIAALIAFPQIALWFPSILLS